MHDYILAQYGRWDEEAALKKTLEVGAQSHDIIEVEGDPVGCCLVEREADQIKVLRIYILPGYQGQGIGSSILKEICSEGDAKNLPVALRVLKVNPAKRLYERFGFQVTEETESHFLMTRVPCDSSLQLNFGH